MGMMRSFATRESNGTIPNTRESNGFIPKYHDFYIFMPPANLANTGNLEMGKKTRNRLF